MKKLFFLPLIAVFLAFSSCDQDESLDPRPVMVGGNFIRLDITSKRFNFDDIENTHFVGMLTNPSGKVVKYNLYVRKRDINGFATEFKPLTTITTFPHELRVTPADVANALGVPLNTLIKADSFRFYAESFDAEGNRADYSSLSATIQGAVFMRQGYRFVTEMASNLNINDEYDNYPAQ